MVVLVLWRRRNRIKNESLLKSTPFLTSDTGEYRTGDPGPQTMTAPKTIAGMSSNSFPDADVGLFNIHSTSKVLAQLRRLNAGTHTPADLSNSEDNDGRGRESSSAIPPALPRPRPRSLPSFIGSSTERQELGAAQTIIVHPHNAPVSREEVELLIRRELDQLRAEQGVEESPPSYASEAGRR